MKGRETGRQRGCNDRAMVWGKSGAEGVIGGWGIEGLGGLTE